MLAATGGENGAVVPAPLRGHQRRHRQLAIVETLDHPAPLSPGIVDMTDPVQLLRHLDAGAHQHGGHLLRGGRHGRMLHGIFRLQAVGRQETVITAFAGQHAEKFFGFALLAADFERARLPVNPASLALLFLRQRGDETPRRLPLPGAQRREHAPQVQMLVVRIGRHRRQPGQGLGHVPLRRDDADVTKYIVIIFAEQLMTLLDGLPAAHGLGRVAHGQAHNAVTNHHARHRRFERIAQTIQLGRRVVMHGDPARHPHAFAWIEVVRQFLGQARAPVFHRQPDALPDAIGRHVAGLLPGREHRVTGRRQPLAGAPQLADLVHQRRLRFAGSQQVLQAQTRQLRVVLDVAVITVEIFPVAARRQQAQPLLAQDVAHRRLAVVFQKRMNFRRAGARQTPTQVFVIEVAAQHVGVETLAQGAVAGGVAGLQGLQRRAIVATLLFLVARGRTGPERGQRQQQCRQDDSPQGDKHK